uniref:Uncharacterized protein n=1 Tax=Myoviridae sp. ct04y17 TaxID=2827652 RepID=A0A8S5SJ73_9CAUD|nr:MAG TPA: hypothetical protein [Myoviridae sp. ct04y17]
MPHVSIDTLLRLFANISSYDTPADCGKRILKTNQ